MDVTNVASSSGYLYDSMTAAEKKEKVEHDPDKRELGVIVEISKDSREALKMSEIVKNRTQGQSRQYYAAVTASGTYAISANQTETGSVTVSQASTKDTVAHSFVTGGFAEKKALFEELAAESSGTDKAKLEGQLMTVADSILSYFALDGYNSNDIGKLSSQLTDAAIEYGNQLKGGNADLFSLQTELTINGASITTGQLFGIQEVLEDLYDQKDVMGSSWEPGSYAQFGLKESQLKYAAGQLGMNDKAVEIVSSAYGKRAENTISDIYSMMDKAASLLKSEHQKMLEKFGTASSGKRISSDSDTTDYIALNRKYNADAYQMFSSLDTSSKERFQSSIQNALSNYRAYFAANSISTYTGTDKEAQQLTDLITKMNEFLEN